LYEGGSFNCANAEIAAGSPLLEAVFAIKGVDGVYVTDNHMMVAKSSDEDWRTLGKKIGNAIREQIATGKKLISPEANPNKPDPEEIRRKIQELFDNQINPGIAAHGGFVKLVDVKDRKVYLTMGGGCQGCGAAQMTLKLGIERAIFSKVPEVTEVVDVTDHASGSDPYYK
jgi:Fe-S cluster biogenesis protein NfuA